MIFLNFLFGYLCLLMIIKWVSGSTADLYHIMIYMFLQPGDAGLTCDGGCTENRMFAGQGTIQARPPRPRRGAGRASAPPAHKTPCCCLLSEACGSVGRSVGELSVKRRRMHSRGGSAGGGTEHASPLELLMAPTVSWWALRGPALAGDGRAAGAAAGPRGPARGRRVR
jgi:hypothetical protein